MCFKLVTSGLLVSLGIQHHPLHTHDPPEKGIVLPSRRLQKDVCAASTTSETILPVTRSLNKRPSKGFWESTFMSASLVLCNISSSCLASVPLEDAWEQIRDFGVADWASGVDLSGEFIPVTSFMLVCWTQPSIICLNRPFRVCGCDWLCRSGIAGVSPGQHSRGSQAG